MWKWLVLGLAVYVLYRLFANDFLKRKRKTPKTRPLKSSARSLPARWSRTLNAAPMSLVDGNIACATATRSTVSAATNAATNSWNVSRKAAVSSRPATKRCVYPDPQSPSSYGLFLFAGAGPSEGVPQVPWV